MLQIILGNFITLQGIFYVIKVCEVFPRSVCMPLCVYVCWYICLLRVCYRSMHFILMYTDKMLYWRKIFSEEKFKK